MDYTGAGGGGGSIGSLSEYDATPGNGGKGYAILYLYNTIQSQYQVMSNFKNVGDYTNYEASISFS